MLESVINGAPDVRLMETVFDALSMGFTDHQPGLPQVAQVVGERTLLNGEFFLKSAHMGGPLTMKPRQYSESSGMGHTGEQINRAFEGNRRN